MVPDLVRDDVGVGEVAAGMETVPQLVVEGEVDVHLLVAGTIKRPRRGFGQAARRLHPAGEEHQLGLAVGGMADLGLEEIGPDLLGLKRTCLTKETLRASSGPSCRGRPGRPAGPGSAICCSRASGFAAHEQAKHDDDDRARAAQGHADGHPR